MSHGRYAAPLSIIEARIDTRRSVRTVAGRRTRSIDSTVGPTTTLVARPASLSCSPTTTSTSPPTHVAQRRPRPSQMNTHRQVNSHNRVPHHRPRHNPLRRRRRPANPLAGNHPSDPLSCQPKLTIQEKRNGSTNRTEVNEALAETSSTPVTTCSTSICSSIESLPADSTGGLTPLTRRPVNSLSHSSPRSKAWTTLSNTTTYSRRTSSGVN